MTSTERRFSERVYAVVARIPRGCVATYGDVAAEIGQPRAARQVGYAMHRCPQSLPWHRVVNARGRISLPVDSTSGIAQRRRLGDEGIVFVGGQLDLARHRWDPALD
ncbi:MGMT family protein [Salinisphaera sp. Q1T1-3]|uniref:MGMT family protein n=1 Tax=Salinisphaera sp. Q1T1-3 TaxID=2321229 RepID=UPI000E75CAD8|nr:methylated-DNA--[protein]-cysteine S-methyltransferase [Salinisphaera sp. Q1T1-3]RJS95071.1 methylated-DNA--[protein]-cysteine S-methyltransferase [Salinisphaera sp. Q1T1-3]